MDEHNYVQETEHAIMGFSGKNEFMSNFSLSVTRYFDGLYPSVEHAYQAAKSLTVAERIPFMIGGSYSPGKAKKEGQKLKKREDWEDIKYDVMLGLVFNKFHRRPELREKLLATGDKYLEETNHWGDNTWGRDYRGDIGKNWLGIILMRVRACLQPVLAHRVSWEHFQETPTLPGC